MLEQASKHTLVVHERGQPLGHLPILGVKEAPEHARDRLLLRLDMRLELTIDVAEQRRAHVLEACLLGLRVGVGQRPESDGPRVVGELLPLALRQLAEDVHRVGAGISDLGGDEVLAGEDVDGELCFVGGAGHLSVTLHESCQRMPCA